MSLAAVNLPKYCTVLNGGGCKLGTGASTVGATVLGIDGIVADAKICYTAGAFGGMVESLMVSINDTVAVNMFVYILDGATVYPIGICNIPINSGNLGTAYAIDVINSLAGLPYNSVYRKYIPLRANQVVKVAVLAPMTVNKSLWATTSGVDFIA